AIIRELRGERIDIIEWSEDPAVFAANALSPAKVSKVEINSFEEKRLTVTVPEDQLSLAIGKKGQNVRLAAKLVGWHIDIRSAEEAAGAAAAQLEAVMAGSEATLTNIRESLALDQITAERLRDRGIETIEQLASTTVDELVDLIDISLDEANSILEKSRRLLAQKQAREARAQREADKEPAEGGAVEEGMEQHAASIEPDASAAAPLTESIDVLEGEATEGSEGEAGVAVGSDVIGAGQEASSFETDGEEGVGVPEPEIEHHEAAGPMPLAGLEAQAPGAAVVPETHAEWRDHVEEEEHKASGDESESEGD